MIGILAGRERVIAGDGVVGGDSDEAARHAPADILRDLLLEIAIEFRDATGESAAVVMRRQHLKAASFDHEPCTSRR